MGKGTWPHIDGHGVVYEIRNQVNDWLYIGSTQQHPSARWSQHKSELNHGVHPARLMQEDWRRFGEEAFEMNMLEAIHPDESDYEHRARREQEWIDRFLFEGLSLYNSHRRVFSRPHSVHLGVSLGPAYARRWRGARLEHITWQLSEHFGRRISFSTMINMIADGDLDVVPSHARRDVQAR